jgi:branched-chain amino acid transport system ATP-binding protein
MMGAFTRPDRGAVGGDLDVVYGYFPILKERADQRAAYLSGGQQQMLVIGRGLMARPKLMLLDEPSLGLSPLLVQEIFGIIRRLNSERKVTMLLVEQNANMALKTADYGYVLEVGRIVMADSCERLMQKEDIKEFYLGIKEQGARGKRRWKKRKTWR